MLSSGTNAKLGRRMGWTIIPPPNHWMIFASVVTGGTRVLNGNACVSTRRSVANTVVTVVAHSGEFEEPVNEHCRQYCAGDRSEPRFG
jgi:hypothetical protein